MPFLRSFIVFEGNAGDHWLQSGNRVTKASLLNHRTVNRYNFCIYISLRVLVRITQHRREFQAYISNYINYEEGVEITEQPLMFKNWYTFSHTSLDMWLLIHIGIKVNPCFSDRGPAVYIVHSLLLDSPMQFHITVSKRYSMINPLWGLNFRYVIFKLNSVPDDGVSLVKLPWGDCLQTSLMIRQHWFS